MQQDEIIRCKKAIAMTSTSSQRTGRRAFQLLSLVAFFVLTFHTLKNVAWLSTLSEKHRRTQQAAEQQTFYAPPPPPSSSTTWASTLSYLAVDKSTTNTTLLKVNEGAQLPVSLSVHTPQNPRTNRFPSLRSETKKHDNAAMVSTTDNMKLSVTISSAATASSLLLPLCTRQQIQTGEWRRLTLDKPPYVSRNKHLRCYPDEVYKTSPWMHTWDWQPISSSISDSNRNTSSFSPPCTLSAWNATEFCSLMQHATISIIGDSLSWEQYSSLLQLLGQHVRQTDQHKSKAEKRNHVQLACPDDQTSFVFRNDPRLEHVTDSIQNNFPLVLILNRGAHYVNDSTLIAGIRKNVPEIQAWKETCLRTKLRCHLFWRTTVPGHPHCVANNDTSPVNNLTLMEERVNNVHNYDNVSIHFNWHRFQHQNELIERELAPFHHDNDDMTTTTAILPSSSSSTSSSSSSNKTNAISYRVIDAYHLNLRRPDEHRAHADDCLHNCYPGKMDVYNQLLLHYLKMDRTRHDVQRLQHLFQLIRQAKQKEQAQHELLEQQQQQEQQ
jgi:GDSL/SGNH-like Acyl-Esterase family found in Pmr5 and Cas1p